VADLARGTLVARHTGSQDAPWEVSWEFRLAGQRCQWRLSDSGGGQVSAVDSEETTGSARGSSYVPLRQAIRGRPENFLPDRQPPLPPFSLGLLLGKDGIAGEAPLLQANGGYLDPALEPHHAFAEMAAVSPWTQQPNRTYSLAWVLRRVVQRGILMIGEQLRGIGAMGGPLRTAGRYSSAEMASGASGFEPYALPLRLARLKNGTARDRGQFRHIQALFGKLAPGRVFELSLQVTPAGHEDGDAEVAVTVLVAEDGGAPGSSWELPIEMCGADTWEALVLAEALASEDRVVILDEPALNLHPGWQQHLLGLLRQRTGQSLLITHSPYLLPVEDESDIYRIIRISRVGGVSSVSRAARPVKDPAAVVRDYSMSADAGSLLFASGAVLVEGETELGALPLWFAKSTAAKELGDPRTLNLAFYAVGSEDHFKAPLTLLAALGIPWAIVCDGGPFRVDMGRKQLFRQGAAVGAASSGLRQFISSVLDDQSAAAGLTFHSANADGRRHSIFTLAPGWERAKADGISAESFEAFVDAAPGLAGQLAAGRAEVGDSKVRIGRWLAETHPCPDAVDRLYGDIVRALGARQ
jgi:hypothetical protein